MNFEELKNQTAEDCIEVAGFITRLAEKIKAGNLGAFEEFWFEGGTEEGDAKIDSIREMLLIRYGKRKEDLE